MYKLGFGGEVELLPSAHWYAPNPIVRGGIGAILPMIAGRDITRRMANRLKVT